MSFDALTSSALTSEDSQKHIWDHIQHVSMTVADVGASVSNVASEEPHKHIWDHIQNVTGAVLENVTEFTDFKSWDVIFHDPSLEIDKTSSRPEIDQSNDPNVAAESGKGDLPEVSEVPDAQEIRKRSWKQTKANLRAILFVGIYYIIGVGAFNHFEGWDILTCVYYITITSTSVGYGDFHPTNEKSRLFAIFYFFFGVIIVLNVVGQMMEGFFFSFDAWFLG